MLIPQAGTKFKHIQTGIQYEVKRVTRQFVILYSPDGSSQVLVEKKSLPSFFESDKISQAEPAQEDAA
jgi:hypothetical protein